MNATNTFRKLEDLSAESDAARDRIATGRAPITVHTARADLARIQSEVADLVFSLSDAEVAEFLAVRRAR